MHQVLRKIKKDANLTYDETQRLGAFMQLSDQYNGRVAAKCIYNHGNSNPHAPFKSCAHWKSNTDKLIVLGIYLDPTKDKDTSFSAENKVCNQWLLNMHYLSDVEDRIENTNAILSNAAEREKKEKEYMCNTLTPPYINRQLEDLMMSARDEMAEKFDNLLETMKPEHVN